MIPMHRRIRDAQQPEELEDQHTGLINHAEPSHYSRMGGAPSARNPSAGAHSAGHQARAKHMEAKKKSLDELMQFAHGGMAGELRHSLNSIPGEEGSPEEEAAESPEQERLEQNGVPTHTMPNVVHDSADHAMKHAMEPPQAHGETPTIEQDKPDEHEALHSMLKAIHARRK